jgi:hypothetical protein
MSPPIGTRRILPSLNKFHAPFRLRVNDTRGSRDYFLFRLAETYLIAAEALLRDGSAADGLSCVKRGARARGDPDPLERDLFALNPRRGLRTNARQQRAARLP